MPPLAGEAAGEAAGAGAGAALAWPTDRIQAMVYAYEHGVVVPGTPPQR